MKKGQSTSRLVCLVAGWMFLVSSSACISKPPKNASNRSNFSFQELDHGRLEVLEADKSVFVYNFGIQSKEGIPQDRNRSTYVHPIYNLNGEALTDDFPEDHHHHRGLSWMWPNVWVGEESFDLWHIRGIRQKFKRWLVRELNPDSAELGINNGWFAEDKEVMDERVYLKIHPADEIGRLLDLSLRWKAREKRIRLRGADQRAYGGLCFRLAPRKEAVITSPDGVMSSDSDLIPMVWADQSGRFGEGNTFSGVTIMQHPQNPDYPAGWCLRHYGFIGVSWPGEQVFAVDPNQQLYLRFRIWIHQGRVTPQEVEQVYSDYLEEDRD